MFEHDVEAYLIVLDHDGGCADVVNVHAADLRQYSELIHETEFDPSVC